MTTSFIDARKALRSTSALGVLAIGMTFAAPAFAQAADPSAQAQSPAQVERNTQQENPQSPDAQAQGGSDIVVTGSLLRTNTETASPLTTLTADTLAKAGITNINDAVRSVSADGAGSISTGFQAGFSAGGAAVSLRGLGVSSTLVLIDGLRSTNFPLNDDGHNAYVDLNSIPFSVVERVDVLKDGASSTYGADAIGGVVNLRFKKNFTGVSGAVEGGIGEHGYASMYRANMIAGIGDYDSKGWNIYVGGEYQFDGAVSGQDVGFPFNTTDLSSIGLADQNQADSSLGTTGSQNVNAVVRRTTQTNLNDPFAGGTSSGLYQLINPALCARTYTLAAGTGCAHDNTYEYSQVQPQQERYNFTARASAKLGDFAEGYLLGTYAHNEVTIRGTPPAVRQRQPYGASPTQASNNPGIVLPVYVCSAGINCSIAADRRLNPNNPYAVAGANPATDAARIYYLFGDIPNGSTRTNQVYRIAGGLNGEFGDGFNWRIDGVYARDDLELVQRGVINIAGLRQVVNTGAYNFVNPALNTQAVRDQLAPTLDVKSHTSLASVDVSVSKALFTLPGGDLQLAVGGQVRREIEENNSLNPNLENYANTAQAFGKHTVSAAYFELDAPIADALDINVSGRYDHYSEGFDHFSPKVEATFNPISQVKLRGTYSQGFRAPTFAESNPRSSFPGFVTYQPPGTFCAQHGGAVGANGACVTGGNGYNQSYSVGGGFAGNPDLKPETSRSFTGGIVVQPTRWLSLTVDYYNIKKNDVIVAGPQLGDARAAYFAATNLAAATAAVAAFPGYSVGAVDAIDPLFPNALPRVLVINAPYVNAGYFKTQGLDFGLNANIPITDGVHFTSRVDVTDVLKFDVNFGGTDTSVRKYVGTLGPYELSSGAGTPKWRGNWQNTLDFGTFTISATTYYVSSIKQYAADEEEGGAALSCRVSAPDLYPYPDPNNDNAAVDRYCSIKRFIYADLNASVRVNDRFTFSFNVENFTNERAPIAPASYSGVNYLPTWHYAGVIGRTFRAGANFKF